MKIEHNVKVPMMQQRRKGYVGVFKDFLESEDKNIKIEYGDVKTATAAAKNMCQARTRMRIYDITITRRQNTVYLMRENIEGTGA